MTHLRRLTFIGLVLTLAAGALSVALAGGAPAPTSEKGSPSSAHSGDDPALRLVASHRRKKPLRVRVTLSAAGSRYVGTKVPIKGYLSGNTRGVRKKLIVQRKVDGVWRRGGMKFRRPLGAYRLPAQTIRRTGKTQFRTVVRARGRTLRISNVISVRGVAWSTPTPRPANITQERTIDGTVTCEHLRVELLEQERTSVWTWNATTRQWELSWTDWHTVATRARQAQAADCIKVVTQTSADVLLPDIRIKNLDQCGKGDRDLSGGSCFRIVNPAPDVHGFSHLAGRKLLKFPVITLNVGDGPTELVADRSSPTERSWRVYQTFLRPDGERESVTLPGLDFYYAGDGHRHWHVEDFDDYMLLDAGGEKTVRTAEKHGYCLQDNTTYTPLRGRPGVPDSAVYTDATQCAKGLPDTLAMIHGMSRGWGDTYPSTLPDQALDITGLPDGKYVVKVVADARGYLREMDETNNAAWVTVEITGDEVTVDQDTAGGGLP